MIRRNPSTAIGSRHSTVPDKPFPQLLTTDGAHHAEVYTMRFITYLLILGPSPTRTASDRKHE
jgi:hypothetical protein